MTWSYDESYERVQQHLDGMGEIEIEPLVREMDLENLSETRCRDIFGAHVYGEIANGSALVSTMTTKVERQRLVQAVHVYQREVARIADAVGAKRVHFQGGRAHLLIYRPIQNAEKIAAKAVLLQMILDRYGVVFSGEFADLPDVRIRSGADIGQAIGTRNGIRGDRELLFLGAPANHAAKLLNEGADRRLTDAIREALPDDLAAFVEADEGRFKLRRPSVPELEELLNAYGIEWSTDDAADWLADDLEQFPADKVGLWGASERIDFDELSFTNSKLIEAATLYGDVSGFTAYIDGADNQDDQREALRAFHAIRLEMARVVKDDHDGVRVQYQGDRVQALFHLPQDDASGFSSEAVSAAVGLQSSFELVLKILLPQISALGIAVGVSQGTTIATKLGERAHRDRICLGVDVLRAEQNEERVGKRQIGISGNVRDNLPEVVAKQFEWDAAKNCYVATGLTQDKLDLAKSARGYAEGKSAFIKETDTGPVVTTRPGQGREVKPAPSWSR